MGGGVCVKSVKGIRMLLAMVSTEQCIISTVYLKLIEHNMLTTLDLFFVFFFKEDSARHES